MLQAVGWHNGVIHTYTRKIIIIIIITTTCTSTSANISIRIRHLQSVVVYVYCTLLFYFMFCFQFQFRWMLDVLTTHIHNFLACLFSSLIVYSILSHKKYNILKHSQFKLYTTQNVLIFLAVVIAVDVAAKPESIKY